MAGLHRAGQENQPLASLSFTQPGTGAKGRQVSQREVAAVFPQPEKGKEEDPRNPSPM